ncbi:MAG TPA: hypothetical protein VJK06_01530, partial [Methyloceanibacter sp.]|nr:hypothetical protein [Methyloceanibacter sp.]
MSRPSTSLQCLGQVVDVRHKAGHDVERIVSDHYDVLETRDPATREREQFTSLPNIVARAMTAPGWAKHLTG